MKFCSVCGNAVTREIPQGDNRQRFVCKNCDEIHYQNPRIIVGTLPLWNNQVLLCKRAIEPRLGKWTLPAGFMENGETLDQGALRETTEEANATVLSPELFSVIDLPHIHQVYVFFKAQLADLDFSAGCESLEVMLFDEADIPWQELAFPTINMTLKHYFENQHLEKIDVLHTQFTWDKNKPRQRP